MSKVADNSSCSCDVPEDPGSAPVESNEIPEDPVTNEPDLRSEQEPNAEDPVNNAVLKVEESVNSEVSVTEPVLKEEKTNSDDPVDNDEEVEVAGSSDVINEITDVFEDDEFGDFENFTGFVASTAGPETSVGWRLGKVL